MPTILDAITQALGPEAQQQIAQHLGVDPSQVGSALQAGIPTLLAGLANQAAQPGALQSLVAALDRDHDGSILNDVAGYLRQGQGAADSGAGILGHLFGGQQDALHAAIAQHAGLDAQKVSAILAMAAPVVMGALGRARAQGGLDPGALASLLGDTHQASVQQTPLPGNLAGLAGQLLGGAGGGASGGIGGLLGGLLGGQR